jgi:hypothetical protein
MRERSFEEILDESLDLLRTGASIEDCIAPYPRYADRLREQLITAQDLYSAQPQARPAGMAEARGRNTLLAAVADQRTAAEGGRQHGFVPTFPALFADRSLFTMLPKAVPAVVAMLILGSAAWGVSAATTGDASPGGWFADSSSAQRSEFRGTITAIDANSVTLISTSGEVAIAITGDTEFEDVNEAPTTAAAFAVGDFVKVSAIRDANGALIAREIEHEDDGDGATPADLTPMPTDDDRDDDNSGPGNADDVKPTDELDDHDNSGPGNGDDGDRDDHDNSGPGSGTDDDEQDNSGPGNGDDGDDGDDNSGSGSGGDDDDNSGHGGGDDDNSGSGGGGDDD